ncbi:ABC transporter ATP-binding protein [Haladaptatus sp. AB643]|uniref:ABC transporter ATP-binding protein n=1 Tax=Haladaptatus sp. AB643 TaxID=2934174 RepID=UPI00209BEE7B|nr:ABC transporter ATP-binding protein [Haladaptatus sp. AB643]MCO8245543.1 ABC transporter ATP-binding protein [Haladaptatus sp. AB643]
MSPDPLLSVDDLRVTFDTDRGVVHALDGVSFDVNRGETVCLVGESGSGKTVACESLTRLVPSPPARISGTVRFDGRDLLSAGTKTLNSIRGGRIAYVFQNPQDTLDPVYTVGRQLVEAIRLHRDVSRDAARRRAIELLDRVGIPNPAERFDEYPHEFSCGMKQRVVIAMALSCEPDLLVADEPTTALDVTTQSGILHLLKTLQAERDMAVLFVTHDLGVVAQVADRVVVLYAGKVMERGDVFDIFDRPAHPYTDALLDSVPRRGRTPKPIGGSLPDPTDPPDGCRFHPRCPHATDDCREGPQPPLQALEGDGHRVSCVYYDDDHDAGNVNELRATAETTTATTMEGTDEPSVRDESTTIRGDER